MDEQLALITSNIKKGISDTEKMTATPGKGVTRLPFTLEARKCAVYLADRMKELGLSVETDASGAVIGVLEGRSKERIMIGSHYDSVEHGGAYDGMAGILCGIEIAAYYIRNKMVPPYTLEIVATNDEEGARFGGGYFSSKAFLGKWETEDMKKNKDAKGISYFDAMNSMGFDPNQIKTAIRDTENWKGFLEVHIEQGPVLEKSGSDIGIVDAIVAMERCYVTIQGKADHAGTQPMNGRLDAVKAGMEVIQALHTFVSGHPSMVGTVGEMHVFPNQINIVPERMVFSIDIRSTNEDELQECLKRIRQKLETEKEKGYLCDMVSTLSNSVTRMKPEWTSMLQDCANRLGYSNEILSSGAGHDAAIIGKEIDTVMLFVPSIGGRSHIPEEKSDEKLLAQAVLVAINFIEKCGGSENGF